MKKLANKFCFLGLAAALAVTFSLSGCSSPPPPQQAQNAPQAVPQAQPADPSQPAAPAAPAGEVALTRNFYFVFDGSGSMGGSKLADAKTAVKEFLKNVPDDVHLGLYVFDYYNEGEVLALGPNNRAQFLQEIDKVYADRGTPLGGAIKKGVESLVAQREKQLQYGEYRLIVITDGEATDYLETGTDAASKNLIPIYTIGFHIGERHALRKHSVSYRAANDIQQLRKALEEAAAELDVFDPQSFKK